MSRTRINVLEFVSLDGVIRALGGPDEDTSGGFAYGGWIAPHADGVSGAAMKKQMNLPFDLLLGWKPSTILHASGRNIPTIGRASPPRPNTSLRIP
jgi:hypothetical protein